MRQYPVDAKSALGARNRGHVLLMTWFFAVLVAVGALLVLYLKLVAGVQRFATASVVVAVLALAVDAMGIGILVRARRQGGWKLLLTACGIEVCALVGMAVTGRLS
jgi:uncharacterized metal-binding protein